MSIKYTNIHISLQDPQKFTPNGIFGMKIWQPWRKVAEIDLHTKLSFDFDAD
jgi:hypothetical protein